MKRINKKFLYYIYKVSKLNFKIIFEMLIIYNYLYIINYLRSLIIIIYKLTL